MTKSEKADWNKLYYTKKADDYTNEELFEWLKTAKDFSLLNQIVYRLYLEALK